MDNEHNDEHIPYGLKWTEAERVKFAMLATQCPMCQYKLRYGELQQHIEIMKQMEQAGITDEDPRMLAMANLVAQKTGEALDLGLMIAGEQCVTNALMVRALIN